MVLYTSSSSSSSLSLLLLMVTTVISSKSGLVSASWGSSERKEKCKQMLEYVQNKQEGSRLTYCAFGIQLGVSWMVMSV
jgi:hypothetical protein